MTDSTVSIYAYAIAWILAGVVVISITLFPWLIEQQWFYGAIYG